LYLLVCDLCPSSAKAIGCPLPFVCWRWSLDSRPPRLSFLGPRRLSLRPLVWCPTPVHRFSTPSKIRPRHFLPYTLQASPSFFFYWILLLPLIFAIFPPPFPSDGISSSPFFCVYNSNPFFSLAHLYFVFPSIYGSSPFMRSFPFSHLSGWASLCLILHQVPPCFCQVFFTLYPFPYNMGVLLPFTVLFLVNVLLILFGFAGLCSFSREGLPSFPSPFRVGLFP